MKKTERFYNVWATDESEMFGSFADLKSAERWKRKVQKIVHKDLVIKESSLEMELPEGVGFNKELDAFMLEANLTPMQNMARFINWAYDELKQNLNNNYEGMVALEIMKSILTMSDILKDSENKNLASMDEKLKKSHAQFLEAGKVFGIEYMLEHTYDYWRNEDEKDALISHYYDLLQKKNNKK